MEIGQIVARAKKALFAAIAWVFLTIPFFFLDVVRRLNSDYPFFLERLIGQRPDQ